MALELLGLKSYVDENAELEYDKYDHHKLTIPSSDEFDIEKALSQFGVYFHKEIRDNESFFVYEGPNVFDFMSQLFPKADTELARNVLFTVNGITNDLLPSIKCSLKHPNAILPTKLRGTDIGWDVTIIDISNVTETGMILYDTGITVQPPPGWYVEIVPRSGFSKSGWSIPSSMGVIDKSYIGTIKVPVTRNSDNPVGVNLEWNGKTVFSLPLPFTGFQMKLVPNIHAEVVQVSHEDIVKTERSEKGFGSRDTKMILK